jgi:hypothetical protein
MLVLQASSPNGLCASRITSVSKVSPSLKRTKVETAVAFPRRLNFGNGRVGEVSRLTPFEKQVTIADNTWHYRLSEQGCYARNLDNSG